MDQINIRLLPELKDKAVQKAKAEGVSMNALVVQFLQSYANGELELKIVKNTPNIPEGIIQV